MVIRIEIFIACFAAILPLTTAVIASFSSLALTAFRRIKQKEGEMTQAVSVLQKAAERHPADREILIALATLHRDRGDLAAANQYAGQLLKHYPDNAQVRTLHATLDRP